MKKTFIIATTGDRAERLENLLISLEPYFQRGWKAVIVAQRYSKKDILTIKKYWGDCSKIICFNNMIGAHSAKVAALKSVNSDIWCSLDDDMFAIPATDYDRISDILSENRNIGFISGNWARTISMAKKKERQDKLVKQKLVFTGGGLLFRDDVAEIIRNIPNCEYLFDDCLWAMYAYVNGYENYRYLGSIAIHEICTKGGRRTWLKEATSKKVLPPEELLKVRKGKTQSGYNEYLICNDSDLTKLAKELHEKYKK